MGKDNVREIYYKIIFKKNCHYKHLHRRKLHKTQQKYWSLMAT